MSTYLNIARSAKAAGTDVGTYTMGLQPDYFIYRDENVEATFIVDYFFEASENTEPGCGICLNTDGWCGRYFNEQDILSIEIA